MTGPVAVIIDGGSASTSEDEGNEGKRLARQVIIDGGSASTSGKPVSTGPRSDQRPAAAARSRSASASSGRRQTKPRLTAQPAAFRSPRLRPIDLHTK